jgi:hypothetical protein
VLNCDDSSPWAAGAENSQATQSKRRDRPSRLWMFERRSRLYAALHADAQISHCTSFFAAASVITGLFCLRPPSLFLCELSQTLEAVNLERAEQIRRGTLYTRGSVQHNTADFVHYEQSVVQLSFDQLRRTQPDHYRREIQSANQSLRGFWVQLSVRLLKPYFARTLLSVTQHLGRSLDIAKQTDREFLGRELAKDARGAFCSVPRTWRLH